MTIEDELKEKLRKVEALFMGAATPGERDAAGAAMGRLKAKLAETTAKERPIELKLTLPDGWAVRLFIALCRRYGLRPYRYPRQRRTTVMVRAPKSFFDAVIWREFNEVHADLHAYLEETTARVISDAIHADTRDADTVAELVALR